MANRFIFAASTVGMALGLISLAALPVTGQVTDTGAKYDVPRTPDGHPDLQGTYDLATMTPLERGPVDPPSQEKKQAKARKRPKAERGAKSAGGDEPLPPDRPAPPVG